MSVYDIPNVNIERIGNPTSAYRITANEGYCIQLPEHERNTYKSAVALRDDYNFGLVLVLKVSDLEDGCEII